MYKKIKEDGNTVMYGIEIKDIGVIVKLVEGGVVTTTYVPGVKIEPVAGVNVPRSELVPIDVNNTQMMADLTKGVSDLFEGMDDVLKRG
jgi:hypothetical protein